MKVLVIKSGARVLKLYIKMRGAKLIVFTDYSIKKVYRTNQINLKEELIIPLLKESKYYDRAAGFFGISVLLDLAEGIIPLYQKGGKVRVITSVKLSHEDAVEILHNQNKLKKIEERELLREIETYNASNKETLLLDIIANLISIGAVEIKIAHKPDGGIYHEKFGILFDEGGNRIYYSGSLNETYSAYNRNVENIITFTSWSEDKEYICEEILYFQKLWNNDFHGMEVVSVPEAVRRELLDKYKKSDSPEDAIDLYTGNGNTSFGNEKNLYPYQQLAITEFENNNFRHFFEMATGTGKTFTAIKAMAKIREMLGAIPVIILTHQVDIQRQWQNTLLEERLEPFIFGGCSEISYEAAKNGFLLEVFETQSAPIAVSTYDTFFSKFIKELPVLEDFLLIVDEAHNLSENQISMMPTNAKYRLGLSATPERFDQKETKKILSYFTAEMISPFQYTIEEAINEGFLSNYEYHMNLVMLSEEEDERYKKLTRTLVTLLSEKKRSKNWDKEKDLTKIRNERSLVVKKAEEKISSLRRLVSKDKCKFQNAVIYCGQGKSNEDSESVIDAVTQVMSEAGSLKTAQFTSKSIDRKKILLEFENGFYDNLVAIKCFDEGIDVPKLEKIHILSSETSIRQTIQRRGRVLRKCKETGKTIGYIYDWIVFPYNTTEFPLGGKNLVISELKRAKEYTRLANNKEALSIEIAKYEEEYGIVEADYERSEED